MSRHKDQLCRGVKLTVINRDDLEPFRTGVEIVNAIRKAIIAPGASTFNIPGDECRRFSLKSSLIKSSLRSRFPLDRPGIADMIWGTLKQGIVSARTETVAARKPT